MSREEAEAARKAAQDKLEKEAQGESTLVTKGDTRSLLQDLMAMGIMGSRPSTGINYVGDRKRVV